MTKFALKGLAVAAGLSMAALATPASAAYLLHLNGSSMDTTYHAVINYDDNARNLHIHEEAYSNGVTFNVTNITGPAAGQTEDLFAFCIDIFHNMSLGGLNDYYTSTYGDEPNPPLNDGSGQILTAPVLDTITTLTDIGFLLHRDSPSAETSLRTAAIQAAIWELEHPGSVTLVNAGASVNGFTFGGLFNDYRTLNGPGSRIFTLTDATYTGDEETSHQGFVVGWPPEAVPEPATWALMRTGFFGMGAMLRRRRTALAR